MINSNFQGARRLRRRLGQTLVVSLAAVLGLVALICMVMRFLAASGPKQELESFGTDLRPARCVSSSSRFGVAVSDDAGQLRVYQSTRRTHLADLSKPIVAIRFRNDGLLILCDDGETHRLDLYTNRTAFVTQIPLAAGEKILRASISNDSESVSFVDSKLSLRAFQWDPGVTVSTHLENQGLRSLATSPKGRHIAFSVGGDITVLRFNDGHQAYSTQINHEHVVSLCFLSENRLLVVGEINAWHWELGRRPTIVGIAPRNGSVYQYNVADKKLVSVSRDGFVVFGRFEEFFE